MSITRSELKSILHYDHETGIFTYIKTINSRTIVGNIAGSVDKSKYRVVGIDSKKYLAHRLAFLYMRGNLPKEVDHINHIKDDNRWENLREVTKTENQRNRRVNRNSPLGYHGISIENNKYRVRIKVDSILKSIGRYLTLPEAITARKEAEIKYGFHSNHGL